ncbi:hypothetical protein MKZ38_001725 [Zalerion maritima]|uniref:CNH domain-containing protein n=1 Tax=Zalerion maritima TaxID=339359 RepID=A0AAD5RPX3_9PEZI|nr:hypothetical protein MKZ38_001725 [Zalerion maritima]
MSSDHPPTNSESFTRPPSAGAKDATNGEMAPTVKESVMSPRNRKRTPLEAGPFVLRSLLEDVPLSVEGDSGDIKINCVEYWNGNLYIGTSAAELLHFFQIPPDAADPPGKPSFILASRLSPAFSESSSTNPGRPGVQQILLLPRAAKACILCNWTVTFYSLPELSPVFGTTQVKNCNWIGGLDLNDTHNEGGGGQSTGVTVLLSLNKRIQAVRIGEDARVIRKIDFAASVYSVRRDSFACVADSRSYALIDVEQQLKIPLMPISSLDDSQPGGALGQVQSIASTGGNGGVSRSASTATRSRPTSGLFEPPAHARSSSLGGFIASGLRRPESRQTDSEEPVFQEASTPARSGTPVLSGEGIDKALPAPPGTSAPGTPSHGQPTQPPPRSVTPTPSAPPILLKPHIASPTPEEFLLVTGTYPDEPGIGIFVNLDGDPTRPTIEFDTYPKQIAVDGGGAPDPSSSKTSLADLEEGYVLASLERELEDGMHYGLEIQRWDENPGEDEPAKYWLECPMPESGEPGEKAKVMPVGLRSVIGSEETNFQEVLTRLCKRRYHPFSSGGLDASTFSLKSQDSRTATSLERLRREKELFESNLDSSPDEESLPETWETTRNTEEEEYAKKLSGAVARLAVWSGNQVWWAMRNPLLLRLEAGLDFSIVEAEDASSAIDRKKLFAVLGSFKDRVEKTELEFFTFSYVKQRAGLLLFTKFLHSEEDPFSDAELMGMEQVLVSSQLDPRVVLSLIPGLRNEIMQGKKGIWVYGGVKTTLQHYIGSDNFGKVGDKFDAIKSDVLYFLKRFLAAWRKMKGFGSVADESEVFRTVDAALLGVLLEIDQHSPKGLGRMGSVRADLYELVDSGVDCFDRAVALLESYDRLYVLSRLYQSRKMAGDVLVTWKRIIEGEMDQGGEFTEGEQRMREYLTKISSQTLVQEYAIWLANRNPKLGVQVFADDRGRAPKFEPAHVVSILRSHAPEAVKYYLEHLVFGKGHTQYVNELITYYLDVVLHSLQTCQEAREATRASYESYRALHPPKPTYRQVLTDNAPQDDEAWHSRLRLLQLLGGAHDYDPAAIRARIASTGIDEEDEETGEVDVLLVPETIILDGRERRHEHALRLLVHRLGDYDTAVSYCLRGGASLYSSSVFAVHANIPPTPTPTSPTKKTKKKAQKEQQKEQQKDGTSTPPRRRHSLPPTASEKSQLFRSLLSEFLSISDVSDRVEQTSFLLNKYGHWFEVEDVLEKIPDNWSVDTVGGFLERAMRKLVGERRESEVCKGLAGTENLNGAWERAERLGKEGGVVEVEAGE